jgi:ribosomal-protein-alanine N-acetyltransferase
MTTVLETKRLTLRPPTEADLKAIISVVSDFDVSKNLFRVAHPYTEENAREFLTVIENGWTSGEDWIFGVRRTADGAYIGTCGVHPGNGWEFGYCFGKAYWGQGYATEAVNRLIAYAFEVKGAEKLAAKWFHDNPASGRVLEKLGCRYEGEEMSNCLARGHKVPAHVVALDRATYRTRNIRS